MDKTIRVRCIPTTVHRRLKSKATRAGMSLQEFLLAELTQLADFPSDKEMAARLASHSPVKLRASAATAIRRVPSR